MDDYTARRFAQAKAINRQAGRPIVRYSPDFDAIVSWDWDGQTLDEQIALAQSRIEAGIATYAGPHPDVLLDWGLAEGDLTAWDENH